jgi:aspartyl protease family protein
VLAFGDGVMTGSSPLGSVLGTAASWIFASLCVVASIVYFDEVRAVTRWAFGIELPDQSAAAARAPAGNARGPAAPARGSDDSSSSGSAVRLRADRLGHFVASADVNGSTIDVLVDTGASIVALTYEDAERAGIYVRPQDFTHRVNTANGQARIAPVMVDQISIGGITVRDVKAAVSEPGKLNQTLLGMTFLGRLTRAEMTRGELLLEE